MSGTETTGNSSGQSNSTPQAEQFRRAYEKGENNFARWFLVGADLHGMDLRDVIFFAADLTAADLSGADLSRANFGRANLSSANLRGANLSGVFLDGAQLEGADLTDIVTDRPSVQSWSISSVQVPNAVSTQQSYPRATLPAPLEKRPPILITPVATGQATTDLKTALELAGWQAVISSDIVALATLVNICIVILSPATIDDPAVEVAINGNFSVLIPVLTEPMSIPYSRWTCAPILLGATASEQQVAVNSILQVLSSAAVSQPQPADIRPQTHTPSSSYVSATVATKVPVEGRWLMAAYCPKCGKSVSEDDQFCRSCGATLEGGISPETSHGRWEYKDVDVPLNISSYDYTNAWTTARRYKSRIKALVDNEIEKYGREGWQVEGASDVISLIDYNMDYKLTWAGMGVRLISIRLRLKRFTN